ncbi:MAG: TetR/AcrR family transcriptional regulator [Clostridia bacterium]|nr:TetR/AcrR family transcriptional regulator [Clostridia bacterium]
MSDNKAGAKTKSDIVKVATKLFYERGYEDLSLSEICKEAGITRTSFFYYFKDKADLADYVCNQIQSKYLGKLKLPLKGSNALLTMGIGIAYFFRLLLSDDILLRFYSEVLRANSDFLIGNDFYYNFFKGLAAYATTIKSEEDFNIYYISCTSIPGNLLFSYRNKTLDVPSEKIVEAILKTAILPLGNEEAAELIPKMLNFSKKLPIIPIKDLLG